MWNCTRFVGPLSSSKQKTEQFRASVFLKNVSTGVVLVPHSKHSSLLGNIGFLTLGNAQVLKGTKPRERKGKRRKYFCRKEIRGAKPLDRINGMTRFQVGFLFVQLIIKNLTGDVQHIMALHIKREKNESRRVCVCVCVCVWGGGGHTFILL